MFYGRIWCVVKPSVGIPLFLGAVATTSLIVHAAVLTNTSWYPAFLNGKAMKRTAEIVAPDPGAGPPAIPKVAELVVR
jgi:light-harvesting protein B-800-850 alpha chain